MTPHEYQEQQKARLTAMYNNLDVVTAPVADLNAPLQDLTAPLVEEIVTITENESE